MDVINKLNSQVFSKLFSVFIFGSLFAGCSTPPAKFNAEGSKQIKTVAFVGFTSLNQVPDPFEREKSSGMIPKTMAGVPTINTYAKMTEHAAQQMKGLASALVKEMGWKFKPTEQIFKEESYQGLYSARMKNWKNTITPNPEYQIHFVENIFPLHEADIFTQDVRDHMMTRLNVDALVMAQIKSSIIMPKMSFAGLGIGGQRTQSSVVIKVYRRGVSEPVWIDLHGDGPESKESLRLGWTAWNISMEPRLFEFYIKSSQDAHHALFQRRLGKKE